MAKEMIDLVIVGAGLRGASYAKWAVATGSARIAAIAEPNQERRDRLVAEYGIAPDRAYADWTDLASAGRLGDAVVIATQDQMHAEPAIALAELGYHIMLEKPMAPTEHDAIRIAEAVERAGVIFAVCHVLRYTPYTRALKALLAEERLGRLVTVQHLEPIGWWHFAHSYVRGNWSNSTASGPMLLTKSCHDLDWLMYLFGAAPSRISSFGGLAHFRPSERPEGATERCLDCPVESTCPYSASRLYLGSLGDPRRQRILSVVTPRSFLGPTEVGMREALRTGPYGRCVYLGENDVVDHQVVSMEFPDGATGSFTATAFTPMGHRRSRLFGTHGYIEGDGRMLNITDFRTGKEETIDTHAGLDEIRTGAHGGGDFALVEAFVRAVASGDPSDLSSDAATSLASHRVVWAAEQARLTGTVYTVDEGADGMDAS